ncbi:MAG: sulfotransferase [Dongiaceae bacterium]
MTPLPPRFTPEPDPATLLGASFNVTRLFNEALKHHRSGALDRAETIYRLLLDRAAEHADLLHLLGVIAHQTCHYEEALLLIDRAIAKNGAVADYHNNRGLALLRLGRAAEALTGFDQAIALRADHADAHSNRGNALQQLDRLEDAMAAYRRALAANPRHAEAHNNLGNVLRMRGALAEAVDCWRQAIALRPGYPEALANLGAGLTALDRLEEGSEALRASLQFRPDHPDTLVQLAETQRLAGRPRESLAAVQRGLQVDPRNARLQIQKARSLSALQRPDEALAVIRQAAADFGGDADIGAELAQQLEYAGESEEAARAWHDVLRLEPDDADALAGLIGLERRNLAPELLVRARQIADSADRAPADRRVLHKALGDQADRDGDYRRAMAHYDAANDIRAAELAARGMAFDIEALRASVDRQIAVFDSALLRQLEDIGSRSPLPLFVVGMPRSGTSLCEQILASHAEVAGAGELNEIQVIARELPRLVAGGDSVSEGYPACLRDLDRSAAARLTDRYLQRLGDVAADKARVVDKHPINFRHLGLIAGLFPQAAIVHCRRDPLDTCFSCYAQNFDAPIPWTLRLDSLGLYYREYERLMAHWYRIMPGRIHDFVYETVIDNLEAEARRLIERCGLAWDRSCLAFHETRRVVRTASYRQVREPVYKRSVGKWRNYAAALDSLTKTLSGPATGSPAN